MATNVNSFRVIFILLCFVVSSYCHPVDDHAWLTWKQEYNKEYSSHAEEVFGRAIWEKNIGVIQKHNQNKNSTFLLGLNQFSDKVMPQGSDTSRHTSPHNSVSHHNKLTLNTPASWDWRTRGAVPHVENQGQMGDPRAYAVRDSLESLDFIKTGQLLELSVVEIDNCCSVHILNNIYECIHEHGGLCTEADYPTPSAKCQNSTCHGIDIATRTVRVKSGDEQDLLLAVLKNPVVTTIDASHSSFQLYKSGVYMAKNCDSKRLDHAMLIVGYGTQDGIDYWICKNSWGINWGINGYMLIARNHGNMCGIATAAIYPA